MADGGAGDAYWAESSSSAGGEHVRGGGGAYWAESSVLSRIPEVRDGGGGGDAPAWSRIPDSRIFC